MLKRAGLMMIAILRTSDFIMSLVLILGSTTTGPRTFY